MKRAVAAWVPLGAVLCCFFQQTLYSQTQADLEWTNNEFGLVLGTLMPLKKDSGVYVTYRENRDLYTSTPEYWFMLSFELDSARPGSRPYVSAHLKVAQPVSIYNQLVEIHRKEPGLQDTSRIEQRIKLQVADFDEMNCPAVKTQLQKLAETPAKLPEITVDRIVLHPMIHALHISGADGDVTMFLADDDNPIVRWAEETRDALDLCGRPHE